MTNEPRNRAVAVSAPAASRISASLAKLDKQLRIERLTREHGPAIDRVRFPTVLGVRPGDTPYQQWHTLNHQRTELRRVSAEYPPYDPASVAREIEAGLSAKPSRAINKAALSVLLESRVRPPLNPDLYVEAASFDLDDLGFPPCVVVAACERLRREATFTPEIAEVIEMCRKVRTHYFSVALAADEASRTIEHATSLLEKLDREVSVEPPVREMGPRKDNVPWSWEGDP